MNKVIVKRVVLILFILIILIFIVYQLINILTSQLKTEPALMTEIYDSINVEGYAIRSEDIVEEDYTGALSYIVEDSEKVEQNGLVANVYDSYQAVENQEKIRLLKNELNLLNESNGAIENLGSLGNIENNIIEKFGELTDQINRMNLDSLEQTKEDLLLYLNKRQAIIGKYTNYSARSDKLLNEIENLQNQETEAKKQIRSQKSGYFSSYVDGYEEFLNPDDINNITYSKIENINQFKPEPKEDAIGKIVTNFEWYYAFNTNEELSGNFEEGDKVLVEFPFFMSKEVPMYVHKINNEGIGKKTVVLKCTYLSPEIINVRNQTAQIKTNLHSGVRINKDAIRFVDGIIGVYVLEETTVAFKTIKILYTDDMYIICDVDQNAEPVEGEYRTLKMFDEVIVNGKGLYDGKIVEQPRQE